MFAWTWVRCEDFLLRSQYHNSSRNQTIEVNHQLKELKAKAKECLRSEKGLYYRNKRSLEAVFAKLKSNNKS